MLQKFKLAGNMYVKQAQKIIETTEAQARMYEG